MATSGSVDWTLTRDVLIKRAYEIIGELAEEDTLNATQTLKGATALNSMLKSWKTRFTPAWKIQWETVTMTAASEVTGSDGNVYTCIRNHRSFDPETFTIGQPGTGTPLVNGTFTGVTTSSGSGNGDLVVDVTTVAGVVTSVVVNDAGSGGYVNGDVMLLDGLSAQGGGGDDDGSITILNAHDHRPITGVDWTTYWKLSGSTGGTWATQTDYTAIGHIALTNVLDIVQAFWRDGQYDRPIRILTRDQFMDISMKAMESPPTMLYLDKSVISSPKIFLWPQPDVDVSSDLSEVLHINSVKTIEDMDATANNFDFPSEWLEAITFNLAFKLTFGSGLPMGERDRIQGEAERLLRDAKNDSVDKADLEVSPRL